MIDWVITVHFDIHITHHVIFVSVVRPQVNELFNFFIWDTIDGERHVTAAARHVGDYLGIAYESDSVKYVHLLSGQNKRVIVHVRSNIIAGTIALAC